MTTARTYVGIDVAKAKLDVASEPPSLTTTTPNTEAGSTPWCRRCRRGRPSGLWSKSRAGMNCRSCAPWWKPRCGVVVNPRHVRDFAKATGQLAKTDTLDAHVLAVFVARVQPPVRPQPDAATTALAALLARRRQVIEMLTAERHRLGKAPADVRPGIQAHVAWLTHQLTTLDDDLTTRIRQSPVWQAQADLLQSVPGVGPVLSRTSWPRCQNWAP